jgi:phosphoribosylformimino-5-aminoimidazole carboxamide ribotide isomerase
MASNEFGATLVIRLIPSMDLLGGRIVRLRKGAEGSAETYAFTPEEWIARLVRAGAQRIHLVDLEGAFGRTRQASLLEMPKRFPNVRFQLGGGLRTRDAVREVLELGFDAVVGTLAVEMPSALKGLMQTKGPSVIAALDLRGDRVQLRGWTADSARSGFEVAAELRALGVQEALVTDVEQDGMLTGPGLRALRAASAWGLALQASGGVARLEDLEALAAIPEVGSAISGKALLDGHLDLADTRVQSALRGGGGRGSGLPPGESP